MKAICIVSFVLFVSVFGFGQNDRRHGAIRVSGCEDDSAMERLFIQNVNNAYGQSVVLVPQGYSYDISFEVECSTSANSQTMIDERQERKNQQRVNAGYQVESQIQQAGYNINAGSYTGNNLKNVGFGILGAMARNKIQNSQKQSRFNYRNFETTVTYKVIYADRNQLPTYRSAPVSILVEDYGRGADAKPVYIVQQDTVIVPVYSKTGEGAAEKRLVKGSQVDISVLQLLLLNRAMLDPSTTTYGK